MDNQYVESVLAACLNLFPEAKVVTIANLEKFIKVVSNDIESFAFLEEISVNEEPITNRALIETRKISGHHHLSGMVYDAISVPLIVSEQLIGAITAFYPKSSKEMSIPYLTVRTTDRWLPLHHDDVIFLEARHRKTHITSQNGIGTHRSNLTELEQTLPKNIFIRCHRSYIVNINHIKEIHPDSHSTFILNMSDQSRVPVSQNFAKEIRSRFGF